MIRTETAHQNPFAKYRESLLGGSILVLTALVYLFALPKDFVNWDDPIYILNNPLIQKLDWNSLYKILTEPFEANYHPLTLISYGFDHAIWKFNPLGYHIHNLFLHLATVLMLFFSLKKIHLEKSTIFISVFLFAIHPVNVECVSWASERKSLLAAFFFLVSFHQYVSFRQSGRLLPYLTSFLFFLLSLLSKASTIVAPFLWMAFDHFIEKVPIRKLRLYEKLPFIVLAEFHFFISMGAASRGHSLFSYHSGGALQSIFNSSDILARYLGLLLWPDGLSALIYPQGDSIWRDAGLWIVLIGLFAFLRKSRQDLSFWAVWFFLFLVPVLNWVPLPIMMANRYLYLPQIGIWILLAEMFRSVCAWRNKPFGEESSCRWITPSSPSHPHNIPLIKLILPTMVVVFSFWAFFLLSQTVRTNQVWRNSNVLWNDVLAKFPQSAIAHFNLGAYWQERGELARAAAQFAAAIQLDPRAGPAYAGLAKYYLAENNIKGAIQFLRAALEVNPDSDVFLINLASIYQSHGEPKLAAKAYCQAISVNPENLGLYKNLFDVCLDGGEYPVAQEVARQFVSRFPALPDGYFWSGICYGQQKQYERALQALNQCRCRLLKDSTKYLEVSSAIENIKKNMRSSQ